MSRLNQAQRSQSTAFGDEAGIAAEPAIRGVICCWVQVSDNRYKYLAVMIGVREVVKTTILEQDPPNHKIVGGVCLHPPCLTSKDGVFIA